MNDTDGDWAFDPAINGRFDNADHESGTEEKDIMNDPEFAPPTRRDTASSKGTAGDSQNGGETCRICRSEGTPEEPLFYPCKCSGSIKFVHQECLMEWLSHSQKKHCELCKTPFRFTKLYDANMPTTLPWTVFLRRACVHVAVMTLRACRALLVSAVWLLLLPYFVRWAWRWMFWMADVGWAREAYLSKTQAAILGQQAQSEASQLIQNATSSIPDTLYATFEQLLGSSFGLRTTGGTKTAQPVDAVAMIGEALTSALKNATGMADEQDSYNTTTYSAHASPSILSSWTYISELTSSSYINRIILDIFEGQLITCVVIVGFILVFLIREWVVQQQPLVNLDNINNAQRALERQERQLQRRRRRQERQAELLEQARQRLLDLQENERTGSESAEQSSEGLRWIGWEKLYFLIDSATEDSRDTGDNDDARRLFKSKAELVMLSVFAAEKSGVDANEITEKIVSKLQELPSAQREEWEEALIVEIRKRNHGRSGPNSESTSTSTSSTHVQGFNSSLHPEVGATLGGGNLQGADRAASPSAESSSSTRRPPMPTRDSSSRAAQIQRVLEEADGVLAAHGRHSTASSPRSTKVEPSTASPSLASVPSSSDGSWLNVPRPDEQASQDTAKEEAQEPVIDHTDIFQDNNDEMPITNAGPDAKINIKRTGKGKGRAIVPEPTEDKKEQRPTLTTQELRRRLLEITPSGDDDDDDALDPQSTSPMSPLHSGAERVETSHQPDVESPSFDSTNAFADEAAIDLAVEREEQRQLNEIDLAGDHVAEDTSNSDSPAAANAVPVDAPPSRWQRLADWFWGDIQAQAPEPVPAPAEERLDDDEDPEAPFVPIEDGQPLIAAHANDDALPENDPEVVAAAQQAGLDAEAVEDAEDLEGIFELIGFQGPIIGLFQTSCFCAILVCGTVYGAVGMPYIGGKIVLSFLGSPIEFLVKTPLQILSFVTDIIVDLALLIFGWSTVVAALFTDWVLAMMQKWMPNSLDHSFTKWISDVASSTAASAGHRLQNLVMSGNEPVEDFGWNTALLGASAHSHASLMTLKHEVDAVLAFVRGSITTVVETISAGSASLAWERLIDALTSISQISAHALAGLEALQQHVAPLFSALRGLRYGSLTFPSTETKPLDPTLVYWSTTDRSWAVLTGYVALAAIAAVYVAIDKNFTRSQTGQKTEKLVRDSLRQAGGVLKVILIISIEMLVFPLYCGLLLDIAFLPLFQSASVASRWAFAMKAPYTFCFVHWFIGTCYMFHFALFVGMCRKILRKGVLWFIRDPDDPTFHPVRDVLERNVTTQLRKIAFSALVYGALVILCLGGVIWSIGKVFSGIFPIHLISTEPFLEFPFDLLVFAFMTPVLFQYLKPSTAVNAMYSWWLRRCARFLRLSHFMFDDRRKDEEGRHVRKTWTSFLLFRKANVDEAANYQLAESKDVPEVYFKRDGKYVLTPCNDQYRPPKPGEATLHVEDGNVYIADKEGKKSEHFSTVYVPPFFRLRVTLFMVCLWMFSAMTGLCVTLLPLCFGRMVLSFVLPQHVMVNDIYPYSIGAYFFGSVLYIILHGGSTARSLREKADIDLKAWTDAAKKYTLQAVKCLYVYGFLAMLPLVFALLLQFYFILPLHTYLVANLAPALKEAAANGNNSTTTNFLNTTIAAFATKGNQTESLDQLSPTLADHAVHIFSDYALGFLYLRIALRAITSTPTSRAAEAVRRITADGYFNPDARLATRFFILPITLLSITLLTAPLGLANALLNFLTWASIKLPETMVIMINRYSYPITAGWILLVFGSSEVVKATGRWRARIRDEVYLVGERLHNFGEKKPPVGSKSVVRRERG
ncbi:ERAD-associated E3 ubiquitin-protein ligase doa10 [Pseudocercospora fuligena]|uniref:RING-type E3 ubiquitin transferase n=1 Tax=Pseudocercospora fuligena TaxID=685502 RepID=A0A8H6RBR1_9PEZI|nr:ERAD-associated E3 ubiquitin-protein ligase doa10 [Pseudocercospora fuligena]